MQDFAVFTGGRRIGIWRILYPYCKCHSKPKRYVTQGRINPTFCTENILFETVKRSRKFFHTFIISYDSVTKFYWQSMGIWIIIGQCHHVWISSYSS